MKTQTYQDIPYMKQARFGDFGLLLADLQTKTVYISVMKTNAYPNCFVSATTQNFGEFVVKCNEFIEDEKDLMEVMNFGLLVYSGHFDGTF